MLSILTILILSYLAGSIPTAIIAGQMMLKDDIRNHGSGNAGATNVFRVLGWKPALVVILIDIGKGILAVLLVTQLRIDSMPVSEIVLRLMAGFAAIFGHIWTIFAGFRGGKGVGTAFGVFFALMPLPALAAFAVWLFTVLITRYVSLGSILGGVTLSVVYAVQQQLTHTNGHIALYIMTVSIALLIVITHRANIGRLIRGHENKIGKRAET